MADMTVIEISESGGPEVLIPARRPVPEPGPGEVLIKVTAAGVNGPDIMQRKGLYPAPKGASDLLGLEVSGEITRLGEGVTRWSVGDRVCALTNGGGYAEFVAVNGDHCLPIPAGVDETDAAGLCESYFTIWSNIFHGQAIPDGGNFLVHGGGGGLGSTAIQLGTALGLAVYATEGSDDACRFCESLGAARVIDYRVQDFVEIMREAGGADIILDIVGGDYIARNIKAARHDARIVQLAFARGSKVEINLMPVMLKRLTYTGSTLRTRSDSFKAEIGRELTEQVWPMFAEGRLRTVTYKILPLAEAAVAHRVMEAGGLQGKILLTP
jgi:putative PIG3 family NAD(P)H quinone oxidoreductase